VIVIQDERIADVGSEGSVKIPAGAEEIDLGTATVMPGLIESHNHMFKVGNYPNSGSNAGVPAEIRAGTPFSAPYITILASINARLDLLSGFTTARDLSSGSTADVDLRNAINERLIPGPRMQVATEGIRGSIAGPRYFHLIDSPWEGRKQVRIQLKNGADFIKVYAAGIRANPAMGYGAPTMTAEEQNAIVDEAHRQGVRVACTAHAGVAVRQSIEAGCDSLELVTDIDEQSVRMLVERGTYINFGSPSRKSRQRTSISRWPRCPRQASRGHSRPAQKLCSRSTRRAPAVSRKARIMVKRRSSSRTWSRMA
jgi:imidazolonepropionase-like amidohydrolase